MSNYMNEEFKQNVEQYRKINWATLLKKEEFKQNHLDVLKSEFDFIKI